MKKYRNYIIFGIIILVLVVGLVIISGIDTGNNNENENFISESIEIYSLNKADISSLSINNEYGEYTVLYDDTIRIKNKDIEKDDEKLKLLLTELSSMFAIDKISENETDLAKYGLDIPKAKLDILLKNGEITSVLIGNQSPTGSGYYLRYKDDNNVFLLGNSSSEVLLRKLDYYRTTVLFSVDVLNLKKFSFTKNGKNVLFVKNDEKIINRNTFATFNMVTPYNWEAEGSELEKILALLNQTEIKEYVEDNPSELSKYGFTPYSAKIMAEDLEGKITEMKIGNSKGSDYYVTVSGKDAVYLIDGAGFEFLDFEPTAFLQRFISLRVIDNIKKFSYKHNDINAEFEIKKVDEETHDVKYMGKLVNQKSFKEAYTEIVSMSTSGTLDFKPQGEPILEYTFTYKDGEEETIKYYKYDDRKIAVSVRNIVCFYIDISQFNMRVEKIDDIFKNKL